MTEQAQPPVVFGRERGIALLALLALVVLGATLALLAMSNPRPLELERDQVTNKALAQAKEALIAFAASYPDTHPNHVPGYLPCPDRAGANPEGSEEPNCDPMNVTVIGRLPWKKLGMAPLRDGSGECLWYAVSGTFKNNPKTELMNWDILGQIEVYGPDGVTLLAGSQPENRAAAVIFAPGVALGQERQHDQLPGTICSKDYVPARFLEAIGTLNNAAVNSTPGAITKFIAGDEGAAFNDRLLFVTPAEIFAAVEKRHDFPAIVAQNVAECLVNYVKNNGNWSGGDFRFPWAARVEDVTIYDDTADRMSGRFPVLANDTSGANPGTSLITYCPDQKNWWSNWKEYLFYALSADFKPTPTPAPPVRTLPITCGSSCLQVNDSGGQVAVVMFAGRPLPGQTRATVADKGNLANYLEGRNRANHPNALGSANYEASACSTTFNDVLHCVRLDGTGRPIAAACPGAPIKERRCNFQ